MRTNRKAIHGLPVATLAMSALLAVGLAAGVSGCSRGDQAGAQSGQAAGGGGTGAASQAQVAEVPRNVRVVALAPTNLEEYLVVTGAASPVRGTDLSAEEAGQVAEIRHEKGARVRKGEALILLDRRLLEAEVRAAEANARLADFNADRLRQLFDANSISEVELLDAVTRAQQAQAAADAARIRHDRAAIPAPFDGIVADRFVELGQLVAPGMPVIRLVDPYVLKLEGGVTEQEVRRIQTGEDALVAFEGVPGLVSGRVHFVGIEANPTTGKFPVEIRVENRDLSLRPGVVGRGRVLKATHDQVLALPRDAVQLVAGTPAVYVVEGDRARRRDLVLGASQGLMVIAEQGLRVGDRVVVRGQRELHDGSLVAVQEVAAAADGTLPTDPEVVTQTQAVSGSQSGAAAR